jgi:hypothetical protein
MNINKISAEVTLETENQVVKHIKDAFGLLAFLSQLSKQERARLSKLSRRNLAFVERGLIYAQNNPAYVPNYMDIQEFKKDVELIRSLRRMFAEAEAFYDRIKDTILLAESEAYKTARIFYKSVKTAAKEGGEGADVIAKDLAYHYRGQGQEKAETGEKKENPS